MRLLILTTLLVSAFLGCSRSAQAQGVFGFGFGFSDNSIGYHTVSRHAPAKYDPRIDPKLIKAANIASSRAGRHTTLHCWQYVKDALVDSGAVRSRPATVYAYQAGEDLRNLGFVQLRVNDPYRAPIGSVLVYGDHGAGHVEIRTPYGFVSDYKSVWRCKYHLIGVYAKVVS